MRAWLFGDGMIADGKLKYPSFSSTSVLSAMATSQTPTLMRVEISEDGSCEILKSIDVSSEIKKWTRWCALRALNSMSRDYWSGELKALIRCFIDEDCSPWTSYVAAVMRIPDSVALIEGGSFLDKELEIIAELDRRIERLFEEVL